MKFDAESIAQAINPEHRMSVRSAKGRSGLAFQCHWDNDTLPSLTDTEKCRILAQTVDELKAAGYEYAEVQLSYKDQTTNKFIPYPSIWVNSQPRLRNQAAATNARMDKLESMLGQLVQALSGQVTAPVVEGPVAAPPTKKADEKLQAVF